MLTDIAKDNDSDRGLVRQVGWWTFGCTFAAIDMQYDFKVVQFLL